LLPAVEVRVAVVACLAVTLMLTPLTAIAQDTARPAPEPSDQKPVKRPPPPLFPRHSRGVYRNAQGIETIDATPQSPPLETDDPGVPGEGEYEINFTTRLDYSRVARHLDVMLVDANYGVQPAIAGHKLPTQLKIECPLSAAAQMREPFHFGVGTSAVGAKFNFYNNDRRGVSLSVYPQLEFGAPTHGADEGLSDHGQTIVLPLLLLHEFHEFTFVFNGALEKPIHDPARQLASEVGVAFGRALTRKVAAMVELRAEASVDFRRDRLVFVNAGLIHGVRHVIIYANLGHSVFADDRLAHFYAGGGTKFLIGRQ